MPQLGFEGNGARELAVRGNTLDHTAIMASLCGRHSTHTSRRSCTIRVVGLTMQSLTIMALEKNV